jgi:hypothetical protein
MHAAVIDDMNGGSMTELEEFRAEKDEIFKSHPQSPLTAKQRKRSPV